MTTTKPRRGIATPADLRARSTIDPHDRNPYDPCWHWTGASHKVNGLPIMHTFDHDRGEKRTMSGPQAVWNIAKGKGTGSGLAYRTCRSCDCVNPGHHAWAVNRAVMGAHLAALGTRKGTAIAVRRASLERAREALRVKPISIEVVQAILASSEKNGAELARRHGISRTSVSRIRLGRSRVNVQAHECREAPPVEPFFYEREPG